MIFLDQIIKRYHFLILMIRKCNSSDVKKTKEIIQKLYDFLYVTNLLYDFDKER